LLCRLTSDSLGSQRSFRSFASVNLMVDRFARSAHRVGGFAKHSGDAEVALRALRQFGART
jgi:hypothetical protein